MGGVGDSRNMLDFFLAQEEAMKRLLDVNAFRSIGERIPDPYSVVAKNDAWGNGYGGGVADGTEEGSVITERERERERERELKKATCKSG